MNLSNSTTNTRNRSEKCIVATRFYGYTGKILNVDLSSKDITVTDLDEQVAKRFLGGLGLGVKILYDEVGPNADAMSPENIVIIAGGPLTGTASPANSRTEVITKSPLTGILGIGNFGGAWGPRLKLAGYDAVVIRGVSDNPVYLWIEDGEAELRSAKHLWGKGKDTWEVTDALKLELGDDISVLTIGPGGENQVKFACPIADYIHAPGRAGAGCVMGTKKLKAIVVRGTKAVAIAHPEEFEEIVREVNDRIASYPERGFRPILGSNELLKDCAAEGMLPMRNWQTSFVPPNSEFWGMPGSFAAHMTLEPGCGWNCSLAPIFGCDLTANVKTGKFKGLRIGGVAYSQPGWDWGAKCEITSFPAMWKCRELANRYGIDEVSGPISFAMELYERGILTKDELGGIELNWGNEDGVMELMRKITYREGIGDILAEGSVKAAKKIGKGAEKCTVAVKGMDLLYMDPRSWVGYAATHVGTLTCVRGGDDLTSTHTITEGVPGWAKKLGWSKDKYLNWFVSGIDMFDEIKEEVYGSPPRLELLEGTTTQGKPALTKWYGELASVINSIGVCLFLVQKFNLVGPTHLAKLYSSCTGWDMTPREIMKAGERIYNLMKSYIVREGMTRQDDDWPARFYEEPIQGGRAEGAVLSRDDVNKLLDKFYDKMGWDKKTGVPTRDKLLKLDLSDVASDLASRGKLT